MNQLAVVSILATIKTCEFACFLARVPCTLAWGDVTAGDRGQLLRVLLGRHLWMLGRLLEHSLDRSS